MKNTTHVWRIFTVLILIVVLGLLFQRFFRPESFGELGHYRAESLKDILNIELVHQGREICLDCHKEIYEIHKKDIHFSVQCEDCHGPGDIHVKYHQGKMELISKERAVMPREYALEGCLFCHRKLYSRPRTFAQVDPAEHYQFLHVRDDETRCIECHNPHEPLFLLDEVSKARIHPMVFECEDCHDIPPEKDYKEVADHPVIFVCGDCHSAVVKDFQKHNHSFMRCTACHLYYRENETSGRIFKNSHQRFCLLCHEKRPFKDQVKLPQITLSEHLKEMSTVMRLGPEDLQDDTTICLKCHFDFVHDNKLIQRLREIER